MIAIHVIIADKPLILTVNANISLNNLLLRIAKQRDLDKLPAVRKCRHDLKRLERKDLKHTLESLGINKAENRLYVSIDPPENRKYDLSPELLIPEEKVQKTLMVREEMQSLSQQQEQKALIAQAETFSNKFPLPVFQILLDYVSNELEVLKALLGVQQKVNAYYSHQLDRLEKLARLPEEEQKKSLPPSEMHLWPLISQLPEAKENSDLLSEVAIKEKNIWLLILALRYGADSNRALLMAAESGCEAVIPTLLAVPGIDVNAHDMRGFTALLFAARNNNAAIVAALLTVPGIDVNHVDKRGWTAFQVATANRHEAIVATLCAVPGLFKGLGNKPQTGLVCLSELRVINSSSQLAPLQSSKVPKERVFLSDILSASDCKERLIGNELRIEIHLEGYTLQKKLELRDRFEAFFDWNFPKKEEARPHANVTFQKKILFISGIKLEALKELLGGPVPESRCCNIF